MLLLLVQMFHTALLKAPRHCFRGQTGQGLRVTGDRNARLAGTQQSHCMAKTKGRSCSDPEKGEQKPVDVEDEKWEGCGEAWDQEAFVGTDGGSLPNIFPLWLSPSGTISPLLNNIIRIGTPIHTHISSGESRALTCTSSVVHHVSCFCTSKKDQNEVLPRCHAFPCCALN